MNGIEKALPSALHDLAEQAPHGSDLADRIRSRSRRRRLLTLGPIAAVLAVTVVVGAVWIGRPGALTDASVAGPGATAAGMTTTSTQPVSQCRPLDDGPLPVWARAGFSDPAGNPFTVGAQGDIAAVVFGTPLRAPADAGTTNKILWVARETPSPDDHLVITGTLEGSTATHKVELPTAPGPSYVDMPRAGCWHLELRWGSNTDSVDLRWEDNK